MTGLARKVIRRLPSGVKSRLRTAVHPAQGYALKRAFGPKAPDLGVLSVVIPAFNVEAYLAQCLDSVISQSYANLEIVIVDDGSTDSTLKIAHDYARSDKRISIIGVEHGGNGRARNIGIAAARGSHLTFADSDDVVAADAYLTMMQAINSTGSDFVVGSSDRLIGSKRVSTKLSIRLHEAPRMAVSLADYPEILDDVFLWNKLFQRKFWDQHVGFIPEGVFYEDQETTARAFLRARSFDVLVENVYSWRQRPDGNSITQGKGELKNLQDRLAVAQSVSQLLLTDPNSGAVRVWCQRLFGSDLTPYFDLVANRGDDYWECLRDGAVGLLTIFAGDQRIDHETWYAMDPHARVFLFLAAANARDDLEDVIVDRIDSGTGFETHMKDGNFVAIPNYWDELAGRHQIPALICTQEALAFESGIRIRDLQDGRGLVLRGHGYVRGLDSQHPVGSMACQFILSNGAAISVPLSSVDDPRINVEANDPFASHSGSGFEVLLADHPELSSATGVAISTTVGEYSWSRKHALDAGGILNLMASDVVSAAPQVVSFDVDADSESFTVDVDWGATKPSEETYLSTAQTRIDPASVEGIGTNLRRYTFELNHVRWGRQVFSYPAAAYTFRHKPGKDAKARPFNVSACISVRVPLDFALPHSNLVAWQTAGNTFAVTIAAPLTVIERSKYGQRQLQQTFKEPVSVEDHVLIESFGGAQCTDSPMALAESLSRSAPSGTIYCSLVDFSVTVPSFVQPLIQGTSLWFETVRTARLLINNNIFPFYFKKGSQQSYLQTWHGTPIKTIGTDAPKVHISASYRRGLLREASFWTGLVAQNTYAGKIFQDCFEYQGPVFNVGYPRNDMLVLSDVLRAGLRKSLAVQEEQLLVLVAPTWRDDTYHEGTGKGHGDLDLEFLMENSPANFTFLIRSHQNESGMSTPLEHHKAIDVTSHPSLNELIIVSDCLITDYSSLVFDYLNTGKPILTYLPNESNYEEVRGTYISASGLFGSRAARTMPKLLDLLGRVNSDDATSQNLKHLKDQFVPMDDGHATTRVLQELNSVTQEGGSPLLNRCSQT